MTPARLQGELAALGHYRGAIDGQFGPASQAALLACLKAGPDTQICPQDISRGARELSVPEAAIRAVWQVEAAGAGFQDGMPKVLPEPHRFSKLTGGRYDASHPRLSYPKWDRSKYPRTQSARYEQLADMVALDCDAGLKAASYGAFQILGENHAACGYPTPWAMVYDTSLTEGRQLDGFICLIRTKRLDGPLRVGDWATFASKYNGPAYRENRYDLRLAQAFVSLGGFRA